MERTRGLKPVRREPVETTATQNHELTARYVILSALAGLAVAAAGLLVAWKANTIIESGQGNLGLAGNFRAIGLLAIPVGYAVPAFSMMFRDAQLADRIDRQRQDLSAPNQ
ncbi:MAG TPA: hypothetical protein VGS28_02940 [Candidatus Saccharimonadales bacterium]|nr:hypothetical protein [Candidatus Saccharimonadales bacterium]